MQVTMDQVTEKLNAYGFTVTDTSVAPGSTWIGATDFSTKIYVKVCLETNEFFFRNMIGYSCVFLSTDKAAPFIENGEKYQQFDRFLERYKNMWQLVN